VSGEVDAIAVGADPRAALPGRVGRVRAPSILPTNLGWNLASLPLALRHVEYDVFHAPAYGAPIWSARPLVVTIHDVSYARRPEFYPHHIDPIRQWFYRSSARRADRVITDSAFSRDEIAAAYQLDPARIEVVPLGVRSPFVPDARAREMFVLHVGDLHRRRNLTMLLDIVLNLRRTEPRCAALRLVLAGGDLGLLDALRQQAAASPDALDYVGRPDDETLADLYRRAGVFAYPSRYEGFGLPALEAMACATPIVGARAGAIPEVIGGAGILVDVDDARGWYEALGVVMLDASKAADLSALGAARARQFTWERTAEATIAVYRSVVRRIL
jgi:glycosyltransferase involved in cell wall biosynthesis